MRARLAGGFLGVILFVAGCGGSSGGGHALSGTVVDGPVRDGKVNVARLDDNGAFLEFRGAVRTDAEGRYRIGVPGTGFYQVDVVSGTYDDIATGATIDLGARGAYLRAVGAGPGVLNVTPVTTLMASLVSRELGRGRTMSDALARAATTIGDLFEVGLVRFDPLRTAPADLRAASPTSCCPSSTSPPSMTPRTATC